MSETEKYGHILEAIWLAAATDCCLRMELPDVPLYFPLSVLSFALPSLAFVPIG